MPSIYVPARSVVAPAVGTRRPTLKQRLRELLLLLALAAPAALAQQAAQPPSFDASWSKVSGGGGTSAANNYVAVGSVDITGGAKASGGTFSLSSGFMAPAPLASGAPGDMIFVSSFD